MEPHAVSSQASNCLAAKNHTNLRIAPSIKHDAPRSILVTRVRDTSSTRVITTYIVIEPGRPHKGDVGQTRSRVDAFYKNADPVASPNSPRRHRMHPHVGIHGRGHQELLVRVREVPRSRDTSLMTSDTAEHGHATRTVICKPCAIQVKRTLPPRSQKAD